MKKLICYAIVMVIISLYFGSNSQQITLKDAKNFIKFRLDQIQQIYDNLNYILHQIIQLLFVLSDFLNQHKHLVEQIVKISAKFAQNIYYLAKIIFFQISETIELLVNIIVNVSQQNDGKLQTSKALKRFNYASLKGGSSIISKNDGCQNSQKVLDDDLDSYLVNKCEDQDKFIVIRLTEDILVDSIAILNKEFYSSNLKGFQVYGSVQYPQVNWTNLGSFTYQDVRKWQIFMVPVTWVRHIKIKFISHHGNEHFCTLQQVKVFGQTMLQDFEIDTQQQQIETLDSNQLIQKQDSNITQIIRGDKQIIEQISKNLQQQDLFFQNISVSSNYPLIKNQLNINLDEGNKLNIIKNFQKNNKKSIKKVYNIQESFSNYSQYICQNNVMNTIKNTFIEKNYVKIKRPSQIYTDVMQCFDNWVYEFIMNQSIEYNYSKNQQDYELFYNLKIQQCYPFWVLEFIVNGVYDVDYVSNHSVPVINMIDIQKSSSQGSIFKKFLNDMKILQQNQYILQQELKKQELINYELNFQLANFKDLINQLTQLIKTQENQLKLLMQSKKKLKGIFHNKIYQTNQNSQSSIKLSQEMLIYSLAFNFLSFIIINLIWSYIKYCFNLTNMQKNFKQTNEQNDEELKIISSLTRQKNLSLSPPSSTRKEQKSSRQFSKSQTLQIQTPQQNYKQKLLQKLQVFYNGQSTYCI